jgi:thioredoxin 1
MHASFQQLVASETPTLVDFFATWCGPCKAMTPILEQVKSDLGEHIRIYKIDVDKNREIASQFNVQGVPTLMVFKNGELKWRQSGVQNAVQLKKIIETLK